MDVRRPAAERVGEGGGWQPALSGVDGERALEWAVRLAATLQWAPASSLDASLGGGAAGLAVLFAFLALTLGDRRYDESARRYLSLTGATEGGRIGLSLYRGLAGVCWAESLVGRLHGDAHAVSDDVDELFGEVLARSWPGPWGLARGLVGVGVYGLERGAASPRLMALVLDRLADARSAAGRAPQDVGCPRGELGMAHGLSGLVAFAALAAAAGRGTGLLTEVTGVMLAHAAAPRRRDVRPAWCTGEVGAAAALALAGPFLSHPLVWQTLTRVLRGVPLNPQATGVNAIGICHGAAGVAHVLHRVSLATGSSRAWEATGAWARALLDRLDGGARCAQPGLLKGTAGVVLVLLSLASDVEPAWDRMLLLS